MPFALSLDSNGASIYSPNVPTGKMRREPDAGLLRGRGIDSFWMTESIRTVLEGLAAMDRKRKRMSRDEAFAAAFPGRRLNPTTWQRQNAIRTSLTPVELDYWINRHGNRPWKELYRKIKRERRPGQRIGSSSSPSLSPTVSTSKLATQAPDTNNTSSTRSKTLSMHPKKSSNVLEIIELSDSDEPKASTSRPVATLKEVKMNDGSAVFIISDSEEATD
jgi:hypothetical protein